MKRLFIDPTYAVYENNKLFDEKDPVLNRDGVLLPFINLKKDLEKDNIEVLTYNLAHKFAPHEIVGDGYLSLGIFRGVDELKKLQLKPIAYYLLEPPLVLPKSYERVQELVDLFDTVYIHNTHGDGYRLPKRNAHKLSSLYWPQPYGDVVLPYWSNEKREPSIVIINGHHCPKRNFSKELYSERIKWAVKLNKFIPVDLYGRGWGTFWNRQSILPAYFLNYREIKKIYKGTVESKLAVMSKYEYALCFENMIMDGYITEKIFDCLYSGTIPLYWGGKDIGQRIPKECYITVSDFQNAKDLADFLKSLSDEEKKKYREAGRQFLQSEEGLKYSKMKNVLRLGH